MSRAFSTDGRSFVFTMPVGGPFAEGDVVALVRSDGSRLVGQIRSAAWDGTEVTGGGVLLGTGGEPFGDASLSPADEGERAAILGEPDLVVGTVRSAGADLPASLDGGAFNRHTFLCGQSGSGKTYTLGAILERLLAGTTLPMVVLDPNADFVGLGRLREDASGAIVDRLRTVAPGVQVHSLGGEPRLAVRYTDLTQQAAAAVMRLDPIADREEFAALMRYAPASRNGGGGPDDLLAGLRAGDDPVLASLADRIENLGLLAWDLWAWGAASSLDDLTEPGRRATVLDLSGAGGVAERSTAALALLDHLWSHRDERRPTLIVIDEAHNVCSADPSDPVQALATERLIDIAAEGRKYGLWLFLSTQRPSKIHPQVLSQCDNLVVMRMNAPGDVAQLTDAFGFAPPAMLAQAPTFRKGEALLAGGFVRVPMVARIGARFTTEGGVDVPVPR